MAQLKNFLKKIVFTIVLCSIIISSCAVPNSYAKLDLGEGDFYYSGTTKGTYVPSQSIFSWIINLLADLIDWILGIMTMGIRMCFVGYTALFEHLLTNALESASGVKANGDNISATDMSELNDSSNSVTIQAIVYNMLPALDVDFFKKEDNRTPYVQDVIMGSTVTYENGRRKVETEKKEAIVSPSGLALKCSRCGKPVKECCTNLWPEVEKQRAGQDVTIPDTCGGDGDGACDCKLNCNGCKQYAALVAAKDPPIVIIKNVVAGWYVVIRNLSVIAMLLVLIFVGIKMLFSNIASEKAQYSRMLVDWVVGVIIIFFIHYFMIAAVNINEILVKAVKESADTINAVQLKQLTEEADGAILSDQEIEIDVYQEIKTRAYDAKLTVGLSGMLMYATLVFFAIKYTIIYLKRFLTLAVLTLMGPAIGVAYAIQKALTGKAQSFKLWMSEYIFNLIIQVVHALVYAVFISAALVMSLKNVAGIIIALLFMNFSLKAEPVFRKIFNLDASGNGLLSATENAGDINQMQAKVQNLQGMVLGTKPVAKALTALPMKAVKTAGALAVGALGAGVSRIMNSSDDMQEDVQRSTPRSTSRQRSSEDSETSVAQSRLEDAVSNSGGSRRNTRRIGISGGDQGPGPDGVEDLDVGSDQKPPESPEAPKPENSEQQQSEHQEENTESTESNSESSSESSSETGGRDQSAQRESDKENNKTIITMEDLVQQITMMDAFKAHFASAFDINNFYDVSIDENGRERYKLKTGVFFGTKHIDPLTGQVVKDTSTAAFSQIASKLTGFTANDIKFLKKEVVPVVTKGLLGMPLALFGMMTIVAHPGLGAGMLAQGANTISLVKQIKPSARFGRFTMKKFASPALGTAYYAELAERNRERSRELIKQSQDETLRRNPGFLVRLKNNALKPRTIASVGATALSVAVFGPAGGIATASVIHSINRANEVGVESEDGYYRNIHNPYNLQSPVRLYEAQQSSLLGKIESHYFNETRKRIDEFEQETFEQLGTATVNQANQKTESVLESIKDDIKVQEKIKQWERLGYKYDPESGRVTRIIETQKADTGDATAKDLVSKLKTTATVAGVPQQKERQLTSEDIAVINKELEDVIMQMSNGSTVDENDEAFMNYIETELTSRLEAAHVLEHGQKASTLFIKQSEGLKSTVQRKVTIINREIETATSKELELSSEETQAITESIDEVIDADILEQIKAPQQAESEATVDTPVTMEKVDGQDVAVVDESAIEAKVYASVVRKMQATRSEPSRPKKEGKKKPGDKAGEETTPPETPEKEAPAPLTPEKEAQYKSVIRAILDNKIKQTNELAQAQAGSETARPPIQIRRDTTRPQAQERRSLKDTVTALAKQGMETRRDATVQITSSETPTEAQRAKVEAMVQKTTKKKIKEKIDQITQIDFENLDQAISSAESQEDSGMLQLLLVQRELSEKAEAINREAQYTLGSKVKQKTKTNALTLEAMNDRSEKMSKYNESRRRKIDYELRHGIVSETETAHLDPTEKAKYEELLENVKKTGEAAQIAEDSLASRQIKNGPIVDAKTSFDKGLKGFMKKLEE